MILINIKSATMTSLKVLSSGFELLDLLFSAIYKAAVKFYTVQRPKGPAAYFPTFQSFSEGFGSYDEAIVGFHDVDTFF